jgi:hypothetical protein
MVMHRCFSASSVLTAVCFINFMTTYDRFLLHAVTGIEVPVLASKRLFTKLDFQRNDGLEAAYSQVF